MEGGRKPVLRGKLAALSRPSLGPWLAGAVLDWWVIALALLFARRLNHPLGYAVATFVVGTRQHALAFLSHDGAHFRVSKHRWLNDGLTGLLCSWPLAIALDGYRKFHFLHHETLGTDRDPELAQRQWAKPEWDLPKTRREVWWHLARDLMGFAIWDVGFLAHIMKPVSRPDKVGPLLWWAVALFVMARTGTLWIAGIWWFSAISAFWAVFRLRMWCEHIGIAGTHRVSARWWQRAIYQPHNAWLHYEHHRWPSIPSWNLARARALDEGAVVLSISQLWQRHAASRPMECGVPGATLLSEPNILTSESTT